MGPAVEAVLLDVGGVFVLPHPHKTGPALGVDLDGRGAARAHHAGVAAMDALGKGELGAYLTAYALVAGVPASRLRVALAALRHVFADDPDADVWSWIVRDAVAALRRLAETGVPLAIVSNSDGTVEGLLRRNAICQVGRGAGTSVTVVVDSAVVGAEKPDPAIFGHALGALDVPAATAVHVGDTVHADVAGARAAGVWPVHLDPFGFCPLDDHDHAASLEQLVDLVYASRVSSTATSRPDAGPPR